MTNSYKKMRQNAVIEWIELDEEQTADLYVAYKRAGDAVIAATFDGHYMQGGILLSTADRIHKFKKVSKKQLAFLQRTFRRVLNDTLYIQGLEPWLISNEEKFDKKQKAIATFRRKAAEKEQTAKEALNGGKKEDSTNQNQSE